MGDRTFAELFDSAKGSIDYWHELAVIDFTDEVLESMNRERVNRSELARRMGTSPAYITKMLAGEANFTLRTMAKIAMALQSEVRIHLAPQGWRTNWRDLWVSGANCCVDGLDVEQRVSSPARLGATAPDRSKFEVGATFKTQVTIKDNAHGTSSAAA